MMVRRSVLALALHFLPIIFPIICVLRLVPLVQDPVVGLSA